MVLFEVPDWSLPSEPVRTSKKRKRPQKTNQKINAAAVNFDKIVKKLNSHPHKADPDPHPIPVDKGSSEHIQAESKGKKRNKKFAARNVPPSPSSSSPPKKSKTHDVSNSSSPTHAGTTTELTALQQNMIRNLNGARFRWINEMLYKKDSAEAHRMMKDDPKVYSEYHEGFRRQVNSWPTNPVSHYISTLSSCAPGTVIVDLGCGDAALARALAPQGVCVLSFDLVSDGAYVIEADVCGHVPLPGSAGSPKGKGAGEGAVADVVVCSLSLMGTNWVHCIMEAWRVMKLGGIFHIAEVTSRLTDTTEFVSLVSAVGFRLKSKDENNTHFIMFEFEKISRKWKSEEQWLSVIERGSVLKPCEYKRR